MDFFALGLVVANTRETPWLIRWVRLALAGLCVGMNVMEAADVGALYSMFVAAFVFYKSWWMRTEPLSLSWRAASAVWLVVAVFAGFIALQTVRGLVGTQIQGVAGTGQDAETKAQHWDFVTQWSLPKTETLGLLVPGLFGYKMDTPQNMMPAVQDAYQGGVYWGGMGRDPAIDRFFDSGGRARHRQGSCVSPAAETIAAFWWRSSRRGRLPSHSAGKIPVHKCAEKIHLVLDGRAVRLAAAVVGTVRANYFTRCRTSCRISPPSAIRPSSSSFCPGRS